jgi:hypothetical protein
MADPQTFEVGSITVTFVMDFMWYVLIYLDCKLTT